MIGGRSGACGFWLRCRRRDRSPGGRLVPTGVGGPGLVTPSYLALRRILGVTRWLYRWAAMMALVLDTRLTAGGDPVDVVNAAFSNTEVPQLVQVDASGPDVWHRLHSWDLGRGTHVQRFEGTGLRVSRRTKHLRLAAPERIALSIQYENPAWFATGRDSGHAIDPGQLHLVDQNELPRLPVAWLRGCEGLCRRLRPARAIGGSLPEGSDPS